MVMAAVSAIFLLEDESFVLLPALLHSPSVWDELHMKAFLGMGNSSFAVTDMPVKPRQTIIWKKEWRRLAQLEATRPQPAGDPLAGLTPEILVGDGAFADVSIQLQYPIKVHHITAWLSRQAYYAVPEPTPVPSFTAVKQGVTEPYQHFIDSLHQAIAGNSWLGNDEKMSMFRLLAFENANIKTKSLLASLPKTADVSEMLEVTDWTS
ncbi:hypothetical protein WISP_65022 [Willisornis vidua]|uniref:Retroviral nucleocapsid Gag protein p24 C-terminal domain-containing protein n=1 Tax=Willisornis vidua TaxID=1566151 RepID=A0ABQ9DAK2_9PASS|nr:hypothetical protein WISP_65022 [Willisornis vidua]